VLRNKIDVDCQKAQERTTWKKNACLIELSGTLTGLNRSAAAHLLLDSSATENLISEKLGVVKDTIPVASNCGFKVTQIEGFWGPELCAQV
jgi:hypothetical protein